MKFRIDEWLDYSDGKTIYLVQHRVCFIWVTILETKNEYTAKALYEFLKEGDRTL